MASAPGPFFSATSSVPPSSSSSNGPQHHLIHPSQEAAKAAGFQIPMSHVNHDPTKKPPQLPTAYPITVSTAGQPPPTTTTTMVADPSKQQQPPKQQQQLQLNTGLVVQQQRVNAVNHAAPSVMPKVWENQSAQKRPATEALLRRNNQNVLGSPRNIKGVGITLATKGGFTLPPDTLAPAPARPRFYSSASRATVRAQQVVVDKKQPKSSPILRPSPETTNALSSNRRVHSAPSDLSGQQSYKYRKVVGGKKSIPRCASVVLNDKEMSPQKHLDRLIESRGYSTQKFCSLEGGYYCKPSPLQKASYGIKVVQTVRASDDSLLRDMLKCGLSPNPCNNFGESVVHMVCRRGDPKLLKVMLDAGCSLQVTDDFGRTPLHDACWTAEPNFECVDLILKADERLLHVVDCRGAPPLSYVKKDHWKEWVDFFDAKADSYWKPRDVSKVGQEPPPRLSQEAPHSQTIKDPENAATVQVAEMIASGKMDPRDYLKKQQQQGDDKSMGVVKKKEENSEESPSDGKPADVKESCGAAVVATTTVSASNTSTSTTESPSKQPVVC